MKRLIYLLLAAISISMAGCISVHNVSTGQSSPAETATAAPSPTPAPTVTPGPTPPPTPVPTPEQKGRVEIADGFYYYELNDEIKATITGISYPEDDSDFQVKYDDLRYIKLLHYDFGGNVLEGELIVNYRVAQEVTEIFYELYKEKYKIKSVKLVDDYNQPGHDTASMEDNNSSAYCYRRSGTKKLSLHSFGLAIDINPLYNPYIVGKTVAPKNAAPYVDRKKDFPGKIDKNDLAYKLFTQRGWKWGGDWKGDKDYQHFYKELDYDRYGS